jgi:hypothetical protein
MKTKKKGGALCNVMEFHPMDQQGLIDLTCDSQGDAAAREQLKMASIADWFLGVARGNSKAYESKAYESRAKDSKAY